MIELITSSDGQIQGAVIKVITNGKQIELHRPISCLYPLEVMPLPGADISKSKETSDVELISNTEHNTITHSKPVREATRKAREKVHKWMIEQHIY